MLTFQNPGLIDRNAITTLGISVKESDNPIGFFGTGIKYAIASILRNGGEIIIWRGRKPLEFRAHEVQVRGQPFQIVAMNGSKLGFTTELGKTWEPWMIFRELWSNCKDEGGEVYEGEIHPTLDTTTISVEWPLLDEVYRRRNNFMISGDPIYKNSFIELYDRKSPNIFYKGILVSVEKLEFQYTPNILYPTTLTEDRTLKDSWTFNYRLAELYHQCDDAHILAKIINAPEQSYEAKMDFDYDFASSETFKALTRKAVAARTSYSPSIRMFVSKVEAKEQSRQIDEDELSAIALFSEQELLDYIMEHPDRLTNNPYEDILYERWNELKAQRS